MSMAGGFDKAVDRAHDATCHCLQIFTKNNNQWRAPDIQAQSVDLFRQALKCHAITHPISHSSYLINVASPDKELWKKSVDALVVELLRAEQLGLGYVVLHPGAHTTGTELAGLRKVIRALNEVNRQTRDLKCRCLLENTAGQGTCLGWKFEHLATILDGVKEPDRLGICFDTCHALAAGYGLTDRDDYRATMRTLNQLVGLKRIKAIHLNDSKRELGSRVDRHEHIGKGYLGNKAFARIVNDRRLKRVPMYLETPKGNCPKTGKLWDLINLRRLRRMIGRPVD